MGYGERQNGLGKEGMGYEEQNGLGREGLGEKEKRWGKKMG